MPGFCGVSEQLAAEGMNNLCRWPGNVVVTWAVASYLPSLDNAVQDRQLEAAFNAWAEVCGFRHKRINNVNQANIRIETANLRSGVLGQAQLPCGGITASTRLWMQMSSNNSLRWVSAINPPRGTVDYYRVALHELGHNLGIGHETTPGVRAIMNPSISELRDLQPWDKHQSVIRYGNWVPDPTPGPGPVPSPGGRFDQEHLAVGTKDGKLVWYIGGNRIN